MTDAQVQALMISLDDLKTLNYWILAAIMFLSGISVILLFFMGKGSK